MQKLIYALLRGTKFAPNGAQVSGWYRRSAFGQLRYLILLVFRLVFLATSKSSVISKKSLLKVAFLCLLAGLVFGVTLEENVRAPLSHRQNDMEFLEDLMSDSLALNRVVVLCGQLPNILATKPDGTRRDVARFTPKQKAMLVAVVALAGDCRDEYWDDDQDNVGASLYHAVSGDFSTWYDAWNADVEMLLLGGTGAGIFEPVMGRKLLEVTVKELGLLDYFQPKKDVKKKAKKVVKKTTRKTRPEVRQGRKRNEKKDARTAYAAQYSRVARKLSDDTGIPTSVILAQAIIEGDAGRSTLATKCNNHFGQKCFEKHGKKNWKNWLPCKAGHCERHQDDYASDRFKIYQNAWGSYKSHAKLLQQGRYKPLFAETPASWKTLEAKGQNRDDDEEWSRAVANWGDPVKRWIYGLDALGYATDPGYAKTLLSNVDRYDLRQYDR